MNRRTLYLLILAVLTACQAKTVSPTSTIAPASTAAPSAPSTSIPAGWPFDGFKMVDAQSGWAWKGISQLYRTDDGGSTWTEIHLQGRMLTAGGFYLHRDEAWLPGVADAAISQAVFHTVDGGKTWTELGRLHGPNLALYSHDSKAGWATNGLGAAGNIFYQVYRTLDGGQTWTQLQPARRGGEQGPAPDTIHLMTGDTLSFMPPNTIWIAAGYGISTPYAGLTVSRDGGKTWEEINPPLPADYVKDQPPVTVASPQFVTDKVSYLPLTVGSRLIFFSSHDSGNSWTLLAPVLPAAQMTPRVQFVNMEDGFAVCGTNLCSTQDGAATWQDIPTPFPFDPSGGSTFVSQFDFVDKLTGWAILADQNGYTAFVKTTDGGRTWFNVNPRLGF